MPIVTEQELRIKIRQPEYGLVVTVPPGTRFSPSARDFIKQWEIQVRFEEEARVEEVPADAPETC